MGFYRPPFNITASPSHLVALQMPSASKSQISVFRLEIYLRQHH